MENLQLFQNYYASLKTSQIIDTRLGILLFFRLQWNVVHFPDFFGELLSLSLEKLMSMWFTFLSVCV